MDAWSLPNHKAFIAITVHLLHDDEPLRLVLHVVELATAHSGRNMAEVFAKVLRTFGISEKILAITTDNASVNDTMVDHLSDLVPSFNGQASRLFNNKTQEADASDVDDDGVDGADNDEGLADETIGMTEVERKILEETIVPVRRLLVKMLSVAYEYRKAIDLLTSNHEMELREQELMSEECAVMKELRDILHIFNDATEYFSQSTPSLPMVIPAMDIIDTKLENDSQSDDLRSCICEATQLAKQTSNRYYVKTDYSNTYRIAMVLHPSHKLSYFKNAGWERDWIGTAEELVREEFDNHYAGGRNEESDGPDKTDLPIRKSAGAESTKLLNAQSNDKGARVDEITLYLKARTETCNNPIKWWLSQCATYPRLSIMAIDYLMIPATSVDVE
ncbi:hypothetical protein M378DRAFT_18356 [Amanita muscaria Koide BX008]|uniref:HAT C-terminal dimerisation domain-containing protein n=1 Tax=Amanita muscaria (strain Koide BX008) TaxID=946122 RepID=A0A0C2SM36_AMAMK|nr:hypothetical protein M378DRAFT_18356 [Amanita muscaria Koide BX008]